MGPSIDVRSPGGQKLIKDLLLGDELGGPELSMVAEDDDEGGTSGTDTPPRSPAGQPPAAYKPYLLSSHINGTPPRNQAGAAALRPTRRGLTAGTSRPPPVGVHAHLHAHASRGNAHPASSSPRPVTAPATVPAAPAHRRHGSSSGCPQPPAGSRTSPTPWDAPRPHVAGVYRGEVTAVLTRLGAPAASAPTLDTQRRPSSTVPHDVYRHSELQQPAPRRPPVPGAPASPTPGAAHPEGDLQPGYASPDPAGPSSRASLEPHLPGVGPGGGPAGGAGGAGGGGGMAAVVLGSSRPGTPVDVLAAAGVVGPGVTNGLSPEDLARAGLRTAPAALGTRRPSSGAGGVRPGSAGAAAGGAWEAGARGGGGSAPAGERSQGGGGTACDPRAGYMPASAPAYGGGGAAAGQPRGAALYLDRATASRVGLTCALDAAARRAEAHKALTRQRLLQQQADEHRAAVAAGAASPYAHLQAQVHGQGPHHHQHRLQAHHQQLQHALPSPAASSGRQPRGGHSFVSAKSGSGPAALLGLAWDSSPGAVAAAASAAAAAAASAAAKGETSVLGPWATDSQQGTPRAHTPPQANASLGEASFGGAGSPSSARPGTSPAPGRPGKRQQRAGPQALSPRQSAPSAWGDARLTHGSAPSSPGMAGGYGAAAPHAGVHGIAGVLVGYSPPASPGYGASRHGPRTPGSPQRHHVSAAAAAAAAETAAAAAAAYLPAGVRRGYGGSLCAQTVQDWETILEPNRRMMQAIDNVTNLVVPAPTRAAVAAGRAGQGLGGGGDASVRSLRQQGSGGVPFGGNTTARAARHYVKYTTEVLPELNASYLFGTGGADHGSPKGGAGEAGGAGGSPAAGAYGAAAGAGGGSRTQLHSVYSNAVASPGSARSPPGASRLGSSAAAAAAAAAARAAGGEDSGWSEGAGWSGAEGSGPGQEGSAARDASMEASEREAWAAEASGPVGRPASQVDAGQQQEDGTGSDSSAEGEGHEAQEGQEEQEGGAWSGPPSPSGRSGRADGRRAGQAPGGRSGGGTQGRAMRLLPRGGEASAASGWAQSPVTSPGRSPKAKAAAAAAAAHLPQWVDPNAAVAAAPQLPSPTQHGGRSAAAAAAARGFVLHGQSASVVLPEITSPTGRHSPPHSPGRPHHGALQQEHSFGDGMAVAAHHQHRHPRHPPHQLSADGAEGSAGSSDAGEGGRLGAWGEAGPHTHHPHPAQHHPVPDLAPHRPHPHHPQQQDGRATPSLPAMWGGHAHGLGGASPGASAAPSVEASLNHWPGSGLGGHAGAEEEGQDARPPRGGSGRLSGQQAAAGEEAGGEEGGARELQRRPSSVRWAADVRGQVAAAAAAAASGGAADAAGAEAREDDGGVGVGGGWGEAEDGMASRLSSAPPSAAAPSLDGEYGSGLPSGGARRGTPEQPGGEAAAGALGAIEEGDGGEDGEDGGVGVGAAGRRPSGGASRSGSRASRGSRGSRAGGSADGGYAAGEQEEEGREQGAGGEEEGPWAGEGAAQEAGEGEQLQQQDSGFGGVADGDGDGDGGQAAGEQAEEAASPRRATPQGPVVTPGAGYRVVTSVAAGLGAPDPREEALRRRERELEEQLERSAGHAGKVKAASRASKALARAGVAAPDGSAPSSPLAYPAVSHPERSGVLVGGARPGTPLGGGVAVTLAAELPPEMAALAEGTAPLLAPAPAPAARPQRRDAPESPRLAEGASQQQPQGAEQGQAGARSRQGLGPGSYQHVAAAQGHMQDMWAD